MMEPDAVRPEASSEVDVTLVSRGITVTAHVEESGTSLVLRPVGEGAARGTVVGPGDPVEVYWISGHEERTLPAKVSGVEGDAEPLWHLSVTGPAERSQRRRAVRAHLEAPVFIPWAGGQVTGHTMDLSEAGMRAIVDGWGVPPDPGTSLPVSLSLAEVTLELRGTIVWHQARASRWQLAVRFEDVPDKVADLLRRRVFEALRAQRAHSGA